MRTYSANGIVLRRIDLGEKDRILTIFTREYGKLSAVAKGSRRPGGRFGSVSEPFTYSKLMLSSGRDLDVLSQCEIKESFPHIRCDIANIAYGIYMLELVNAFLDKRQPNPDMFDTLLSAMYILESGTDPEITTRFFELQLLSILGYEPSVDACIRCGRRPADGRIFFSSSLGGIVCARCDAPPKDSVKARAAVASYILALRRAEPHKLKDMRVPKGARRDLALILRRHIRYQLEHDLKSVEFLDVVAATEVNCPPV
ncbi:MAG: DNA repair protein RecO [Armatimonadetes bacterium]|jgi:DNA repair protein RecO (recombination protein O)|nr:DNA repair protein RecO [Armatimonadota bacterium]